MQTEREKKLAKELAEVDKLKLSHTDYGYDAAGAPCMFTVLHNCKGKILGNGRVSESYAYNEPFEDEEMANFLPQITIGKLIDDLKRNAEDLEEFEVEDNYGDKIICNFSDTGVLRIENQGCTTCNAFSIDKAIKIHQNLGVLIATELRNRTNNPKEKNDAKPTSSNTE